MKLINADELEPDTEWDDYYDGFASYSQGQIDEAEEVKAIPLEKIKQAREEIQNFIELSAYTMKTQPRYIDRVVLEILDRLIREVEEDAKAGDHERTV